ncbi:membrane protein insertase YidC [Demequina sp. B12]|uniref:membrane protein insertase YidC n=1 Tax=Demequina sp. B12 TaxID=2992757 RepID=UPI00237A2882|nr:membrane protein insertase YidC [Demequina sp. B12]MDE0572128.1 membrane protein insertase YidC [Demequina sp. B12]
MFDTIMYPLEWCVANIMVLWHSLFTWLGMDSASGVAWTLSIVGLVVTIRILLIPLFVKQIKSQRAMQLLAPEMRQIQAKYKGKKDQASREAMQRETMALYSKHKTNPFSSCLPILIQAPIFFALFRVLNYRIEGVEDAKPIGLLTEALAVEAHEATLFGAKLSDTLIGEWGSGNPAPIIVSIVLIIMMVSSTFLTQHQITRKNMPASALEGPMAQQQKVLMYALPFIFVVTGPNFPVGVLIYWTTTNIWTMGQQYYVIKRNPTPGSEAEKQLKAKQAEKARKKGLVIEGNSEDVTLSGEEAKPTRQRQQPKKGGSRSQRKKGSGQSGPKNSSAQDQSSQGADEAKDEND